MCGHSGATPGGKSAAGEKVRNARGRGWCGGEPVGHGTAPGELCGARGGALIHLSQDSSGSGPGAELIPCAGAVGGIRSTLPGTSQIPSPHPPAQIGVPGWGGIRGCDSTKPLRSCQLLYHLPFGQLSPHLPTVVVLGGKGPSPALQKQAVLQVHGLTGWCHWAWAS